MLKLELCDEDFDSVSLAEGALALNKLVNPESNIEWAKQELKQLVTEAELLLVNEADPMQRFDAFLRLFYAEWGFRGDHAAYFESCNAFVDKVLERRKGIPVSLGALLLYFGEHLGFPLKPVMFPSQFLIQVQWEGEKVRYLNPFTGDYVSMHTLRAWLIGHDGPLAKLKPDHLRVVDHASIIGRWLALIKGSLMREERYSLALRCTDIALSFVPDDPYEIRDRGFIYQQLDCYQVAVHDYEYFIEHCPDDPAAELLKTQVSMLTNTQVTLH